MIHLISGAVPGNLRLVRGRVIIVLGVWRSSSMGGGALCVTTSGDRMKQM